MSERAFPFELQSVRCCWTQEHVRNALASVGSTACAGRTLAEQGWVGPDVMFAQTLALLDGQRRAVARTGPKPDSADSAVAGGVWVREQMTVHRPIRIGVSFAVEGEIARSYSRGGRLYTVSTSRSRSDSGELLVSSCTTGVVTYRKDPSLADAEHGVSEPEVRRSGPDAGSAANNPALEEIRSARVGERFEGPQTQVTLAMMRARDGGRSRNPIHTEPGEALRAGLAAPIAGGPHVFAFAQELLLDAWGPEALIHGAHFDVRWRAPVHAGESIRPSALVAQTSDSQVDADLRVERGGVDAMVGRVAVPLPSPGP